MNGIILVIVISTPFLLFWWFKATKIGVRTSSIASFL